MSFSCGGHLEFSWRCAVNKHRVISKTRTSPAVTFGQRASWYTEDDRAEDKSCRVFQFDLLLVQTVIFRLKRLKWFKTWMFMNISQYSDLFFFCTFFSTSLILHVFCYLNKSVKTFSSLGTLLPWRLVFLQFILSLSSHVFLVIKEQMNEWMTHQQNK